MIYILHYDLWLTNKQIDTIEENVVHQVDATDKVIMVPKGIEVSVYDEPEYKNILVNKIETIGGKYENIV